MAAIIGYCVSWYRSWPLLFCRFLRSIWAIVKEIKWFYSTSFVFSLWTKLFILSSYLSLIACRSVSLKIYSLWQFKLKTDWSNYRHFHSVLYDLWFNRIQLRLFSLTPYGMWQVFELVTEPTLFLLSKTAAITKLCRRYYLCSRFFLFAISEYGSSYVVLLYTDIPAAGWWLFLV